MFLHLIYRDDTIWLITSAATSFLAWWQMSENMHLCSWNVMPNNPYGTFSGCWCSFAGDQRRAWLRVNSWTGTTKTRTPVSMSKTTHSVFNVKQTNLVFLNQNASEHILFIPTSFFSWDNVWSSHWWMRFFHTVHAWKLCMLESTLFKHLQYGDFVKHAYR